MELERGSSMPIAACLASGDARLRLWLSRSRMMREIVNDKHAVHFAFTSMRRFTLAESGSAS